LTGGNFWEIVWRPFIRRDLKRSEVREITRRAYEISGGSLKKTSQKLGIKDYKKFISYLHKYKLHPEER